MSAIRAILTAILATAPLAAQDFNLPDFSNVSMLSLNQHAIQSGSRLRLTSSALSERGSAFWNAPMPVALGFETEFSFQVGSPAGGGADGLVFIVHNDPRGTAALGNHANALGYGAFAGSPPGTAIANSIAIEFDMFMGPFNGFSDLSANEVSIHTGGSGDNSQGEDFSIGRANAPVSMKNGQVHTVRIAYVPGTIAVFINNIQVVSVAYSFETGGQHILGAAQPVGGLSLMPGGLALIGFTASCGGSYQFHDILNWSFAAAAHRPCYAGTVGTLAGGPFDVLSINGAGGGPGRTVLAPAGGPVSLDLLPSPAAGISAGLILIGMVGIPSAAETYPTPFGTLCFPPAAFAPAPNRFVLADSFQLGLGAFFPATPPPWNLTLPAGLPGPVVLTLQGVVENGAGGFETTNAVVLKIL